MMAKPQDSLNRALHCLAYGAAHGAVGALRATGLTYVGVRGAEAAGVLRPSRGSRFGMPLGVGICTACFAVKYGVTQAVQRIDELSALQRSAVAAMGSSVANPGAAAIIAPYRGPADWGGPPAHGNIVGFVSKR